MATAPPRLLIGLVERLIPPDAREAVLGDLWERYQSPLQFAGQALSVLPFLIFAQVIRRSSWPILGLQSFILFACLRGFAPSDSLLLPPPWARAGLPTLCAFLGLAWHDAYRGTAPDAPPRAAGGEAMAVMLGIGLSQALTAAILATAGLPSAWLLTWRQLLFACAALPVLCVFRSGSWLKLARRPVRSEHLMEEYDLFRSRVRRRNRIEVGAMVATLLVSASVLAWSAAPVPAIVWATLSGFAILAVYLAMRGGADAPAPAASVAQIQVLFRLQIVRQHKLRNLLMWWWLMPLFVGLARNFLLTPQAENPSARPIVGALLLLLLAACISTTNHERARVVSRKLEELGRLPS